jgi:hypothetical protein
MPIPALIIIGRLHRIPQKLIQIKDRFHAKWLTSFMKKSVQTDAVQSNSPDPLNPTGMTI